jgi:low affinity Fe/Cu permease
MEWTDKRMDDLAKRVDDGFREVKGDIARLDAKLDEKIGALDAKLDEKIGALDTKFDEKIGVLDSKISGLQTLLLRYALGTTTGILAGVALIVIRALTSG